MVRAMLHNKDVARNLWGEAVNTACHTVNRVYFKPGTKKITYVFQESLEVLVSFSRTERMWENLTPEAMKEYFWDTPLQARLIEFTTKEPRR